MENFVKVEIDLLSSKELQVRLDAFRRRSKDINVFMQSRQWEGVSISVDCTNRDRPKISGSIPDELVLEALYRRFRFFILNNEDANYYRFIRLLSASCKNELLHNFLKLEKKNFYYGSILESAFATTKYKPEEVIDFWFNAYYFHDQSIDRNKLAAFESIVSSEGAKVVLWDCVWHSVRKIRNMAWLVREASPQNPIIYVPTPTA